MRSLALLLCSLCLSASAGEILSAGVLADRQGLRLQFETDTPLLSRSWVAEGGVLQIEFQNASSLVQGARPLSSNPWFTSIQGATSQDAQGVTVSTFRFTPKAGGHNTVLHREWDGHHLSFILSRAASAEAVAEIWSRPVAPVSKVVDAPGVLAALSTSPALKESRVTVVGDVETVELVFSQPVLQLELHQTASAVSLQVGKARLTSGLGSPKGKDFVVNAISAAKGALVLPLREPVRSAVASRSGAVVVLRLVRTQPVVGWSSWTSLGNKVVQYGRPSLPADEVATATLASKAPKGALFTPQGTPSETKASQATPVAAPVATTEMPTSEGERLAAERRKSQEFSQQQQAEGVKKETQEEVKNRVVYNTFGIRDPFIPLEADDVEGGLNIDQMKVVGIIFSPTRPMAVLEHTSQSGLSVALREGDAIQNGKVLKIYRDRVVFLLEEYGISRQFALKLQAPKGDKS